MDEIERAHRTQRETEALPHGFDVFARGSCAGLLHAVRAMSGCEGPGSVISNGAASSMTDASPRASRSSMARRVGSARAEKVALR